MTAPNPIPDLDRVAAAAFREVLSTQFHCQAAPLPAAEAAPAAGQGPWLTAGVHFSVAALAGTLRLQLPEAWLRRLHASLAGADDARAADLADLAGELCNMTAGRIAVGLARTAGPSLLGTPVISPGPLPEPEPGRESASSRSCWTCGGQVLKLALVLDPQRP
ncbi:MAG: hypothetical protein RJA22_595 [Verrucomicrobiota bacterium]|jgi:hypothetical protein